jgi:hypothetical protein
MSNIPREVNVARQDNPSNSNSLTSSNVCADWFEQCRQKGRMGSESMLDCDLVSYTRNILFSKLKFFMDQRQQNYSSAEDSICFRICRDMGLKDNRAAAWWELSKNKIVQLINGKRADVTAAIKRVFMSK